MSRSEEDVENLGSKEAQRSFVGLSVPFSGAMGTIIHRRSDFVSCRMREVLDLHTLFSLSPLYLRYSLLFFST